MYTHIFVMPMLLSMAQLHSLVNNDQMRLNMTELGEATGIKIPVM